MPFYTVAEVAYARRCKRKTFRNNYIYCAKVDAYRIGSDWRIYYNEKEAAEIGLTDRFNTRSNAKLAGHAGRRRHLQNTARQPRHNSKINQNRPAAGHSARGRSLPGDPPRPARLPKRGKQPKQSKQLTFNFD
jgi:hypothetical protein